MLAAINKPTPPTPREERHRSNSSPSHRSGSSRDKRDANNVTSPKVSVEKIKQLTGSEDAVDWVIARQNSSMPWYLRPQYADQLRLDKDGNIRMATLPALVERLSTPQNTSPLFPLRYWFGLNLTLCRSSSL